MTVPAPVVVTVVKPGRPVAGSVIKHEPVPPTVALFENAELRLAVSAALGTSIVRFVAMLLVVPLLPRITAFDVAELTVPPLNLQVALPEKRHWRAVETVCSRVVPSLKNTVELEVTMAAWLSIRIVPP